MTDLQLAQTPTLSGRITPPCRNDSAESAARARNEVLLEALHAQYLRQASPMLGDLLRQPDGTLERIGHIHYLLDKNNPCKLSLQVVRWGSGSYHLGWGSSALKLQGKVFISHSGGFEWDSGRKGTLHPTLELHPVRVWFWLDGHSGPDRAVQATIPQRIWDFEALLSGERA